MCGCLSCAPHWRTWTATQACALTGIWTNDPLVCRLVLNPLSHTLQGSVMIIEMTTKHLEYYTNFVDKAGQGLRGLTPISKEVLLWLRCCQAALHATEEFSWMEESVWQTSLLSYFKNCRSHPSLQQPPSGQLVPSTSRRDPLPAKSMTCWKLRWWSAFFSSNVFLN